MIRIAAKPGLPTAWARRLHLSGANLERAGDHNRRVVLQAIRMADETTRAELAQATDLTPATIANITRRLMDEELVSTPGRRQGGRGQPAMRVAINPKGCFALGLNIDRDHLTLVALNLAGEVCARVSEEMAFALPKDVVAWVERYLPGLLKEGDVATDRILGVGVALPGDLGSVVLPGVPVSYTLWNDADPKTLLADIMPWPLYTDNDAAAAALGEAHCGCGLRLPSFFYLQIGIGLGGGLVLDGAYMRGVHSRSGEIGLMPDMSSGSMKPVQDTVSLSALFSRLEVAGVEKPCRETLLRDEEAVRKTVETWLEDAICVLTPALVAVLCLIDPGVIVIGGRLPSQLARQLASGVENRLSGISLPVRPVLLHAEMAEPAAAVGAAILPFIDQLLPSDTARMRADFTRHM